MKRFFALALVLALTLAALTIPASAEEAPKVLNWYLSGEVTTMDSTKTYDTLSGEAVAYFSDTLYRLDQEAEAQPNLAVGQPVISEDGLTVTVTIRDDAYYSNGEKIVAGDIVYAARRIYDPAVGSLNTNTVGLVNADAVRAGEVPVEELGIRALSDTELEISLTAPDPYITKKLADTAFAPVSQAFVEAQGDQYGLSADALLSSGPFVLTDWTGADISWKYVKNPYYWDAENIYFDEITITVVKDANTAINLYEAGQLDGVLLTTDFVAYYEGTEDLVKIPSLRMTNLELGISATEALQNLNIRKALLYGLDREELCSAVLNGAAVPAVGAIPDGIATNPETGASVAEDFGVLVYTDIEAAQRYFAAGLEELGLSSAPPGQGNRGTPWFPEQEAQVAELFKAGTAPAEIARQMGRSELSILYRLEKLGLIADRNEYMSDADAAHKGSAPAPSSPGASFPADAPFPTDADAPPEYPDDLPF